MTETPRRWTTPNLARLWVAWSAHELAERADLVSAAGASVRGAWDHAGAGQLIELAEPLEVLQREATAAAVICERVHGASWDRIGELLSVTRQAAQKRFGKWEEPFRQAVALPHAARRSLDVTIALHDPDRYAALLPSADGPDDDRTADPFAVDDRRFVTAEIANVARLASMIANRELPVGVDEIRARLELQDRKIALYEIKLALVPGRDHAETAEALHEARVVRDHVLAQLVTSL